MLGIERSGAQVALAGQVPDEATKQAVLDKARDLYGADNLTDRLTIEPGVDRCAWLTSDAWLAAIDVGAATRASLDCKTLTLEGLVDSAAARDQIGAAAARRVGPSITVDNRLSVRQPAAQEQIAAVLKLKNIEFETGRAIITPAGIATLEEIVPALQGSPDTRFEIGGHTDNRGDPAMNRALSEARARAVLDFLTNTGLNPGRFTTKGYGAEKPVADNATAAGRQQNRRIEFVQVGG
jgi:OOP family OmpA-OmpF porin